MPDRPPAEAIVPEIVALVTPLLGSAREEHHSVTASR
jgi:hypothetical protein